MKKIMFFINTLAGGGAERVLVNLLKALNYEKYDVTVVSIVGGENQKEIPSQVKAKQIIKFKNKISNLLFKILCHLPKKWFASLFLRGEFDIEIAYLCGFPTRVLAAKKKRPNTKKIAFVHGKITKEDIKMLGYPNSEVCLKEYTSFSKVCCVSEDAKNCFESQVGPLNNSMVLYNIINAAEIKDLSLASVDISYKTKGVKFISVGRLMKIKGFERLLRAVNELKNTYDFELWILGQGPLFEELNDYIIQNELHNVRLLGYQDNPYAYMKQADYLVCSSFSEGYSTVAVEALVLGIPVITTDCSGMREILETNKYGYIVENSESGIKDGLEFVLKETEKVQKMKNDVQKHSENCAFDREVEQYMQLFDTV